MAVLAEWVGRYFGHIATSSTSDGAFVTDISDVTLYETSTGLQVFSASGPDGGIQVRDAALNLIDAQNYGDSSGLGAAAQLTVATLGDRDALVLVGPAQAGMSGWWLDAAGAITESFDLTGPQVDVMTAMELVTIGGTDFVFSATQGTGGITAWGGVAQGVLQEVDHADANAGATGNDIFALEHVNIGGADYLMGISASGNGLYSYKLGADGSMQLVDTLDVRDGLNISTPTTLSQVALGGQVFVLVGAAGSSSITVMMVAADGTLQATDQVGDDRETRFQSVSVLETIVIAGKAYVVAGGADDGLSLMTLLPDGSLLHLETIADNLVTALTNPESISLAEHDGKIALYTAGLTGDLFGASAVGRFEIDPNAGGVSGAVIQGGAGDDRFVGMDGAD